MTEFFRTILTRVLTPDQSPDIGLPYWRERAFRVIFTFGVAVGALIYLPSLILLIINGEWRLAALDTVVYLSCLALFFTARIDYLIKAYLLAGLVFLMGVGVMLARGPISVGPLWMFTFPILGVVLVGRRASLIFLGFNAATLAGFWWMGGLGWLDWPSYIEADPLRLGVITLNFLFVNAVAVLTADSVVRGIEVNNRMLRQALRDKQAEIDSRQRAEDELRRSEDLYRQTMQNSPSIIFSVDDRGRLVNINQAGREKLVGNGSWQGEEIDRFLNGAAQRSRAREMLQGVFQGRSGREEELELVDPAGRACHTLARVYPIQDAQGAVSRCVFTLTDITGRKRAEQALRLEQDRLQALLELNQKSQEEITQITDFALEKGVELTGSRIGYLAVLNENETVLTMHSWSRHTLEECAVPANPSVFQLAHTGLWGEAVRRREPMIINDYYAPSPHKKGLPPGHVKLRRVLNVPVFDGDRIVALAGVGNKAEDYDQSDVRQISLLMQGMWSILQRRQDMQNRLNLEEQLRQAQKMEAVGTLAGGIAHDFNNILAAIIGYTELAQDRQAEGEKPGAELDEVLRAANRARDLVRQILTFSRRSPRAPRQLDLNQVVNHGLTMLARTIPRMVEIRTDLADGLSPFTGDAAQIEQVVVNLGINAADAMPDGGVLEFKSESVLLDGRFCREHVEVEPGRYLRLAVRDSGQGMTPETVEKIFDPFFTTKEVGKGTGLGLSSVYGIVKDHGGHIFCRSRPGEGTLFDIYLPEEQAGSPPHEAESHASGIQRGAGETVLVVDDEPALREVGCRVLEAAGYRTLEAASGESALERFRAGNGRVDLVVLDLSMPGMGGKRCLRELLALDPSVKVVVASGYTSDKSLNEILAQGAAAFVAKPFSGGHLLETVHRVLEERMRSAS